jgi:hypothetical protein
LRSKRTFEKMGFKEKQRKAKQALNMTPLKALQQKLRIANATAVVQAQKKRIGAAPPYTLSQTALATKPLKLGDDIKRTKDGHYHHDGQNKHYEPKWKKAGFKSEKDFNNQMRRGGDGAFYRIGKQVSKKIENHLGEHFKLPQRGHTTSAEAKTKRREPDLEARIRKLEIGKGSGPGGEPIDAPVSRSYNAPKTGFKFSHSNVKSMGGGDSINIHGTDYLTTLDVTKIGLTAGTTIYSVVINPKTLGVNRLENFSQLFERYHMKVRIKYNQATTTAVSGSMIGFFDMDVDDDSPPPTIEGVVQAFGHYKNKSTSFWKNCDWEMPTRASTDELWIDSGDEERLVNQAIFYLMVEVPSDATMAPGTLSIDWECRLWNSKTDNVNSLGGPFALYSSDGSTATAANPFTGLAVVASGGSDPAVEAHVQLYGDSVDVAFDQEVTHFWLSTLVGATTLSAPVWVLTNCTLLREVNSATVVGNTLPSMKLYAITDTSTTARVKLTFTTVTTGNAVRLGVYPISYYSPPAIAHLKNAIANGEELARKMARMLEILEEDKKKLLSHSQETPEVKASLPDDLLSLAERRKLEMWDRAVEEEEKLTPEEKAAIERIKLKRLKMRDENEFEMVQLGRPSPASQQVTPKQGKKLSVK